MTGGLELSLRVSPADGSLRWSIATGTHCVGVIVGMW
jgi:hypothetical protein